MNGSRRQALRRLAAWPGGRAAWLAAASLQAPAAAPAAPAAPAVAACGHWPAWEAFVERYIGNGGRVVEQADARQRTVSEAQGYAMFFALVAGQRDLFERLLRWTDDNLAGGKLGQRLPAWHWGRRDDGSWGVIDDNAAADADLWIAHALGEAGRLWGVRRYTALAALLAERVLIEETAELPGLGLMLLPGPQGFALPGARWRINPSYLAPMQLRWFANELGGRWVALRDAALQALRDCAPKGLAPDWALYDGATRRFLRTDAAGSYDAIRVYLWLGLSAMADPLPDPALTALLAHYAPMASATESDGDPPAIVDALEGRGDGAGPPGFSAALLPFLRALGRPRALRQQLQRLQSRPPAADAYYDQMLTHFGLGAHEGRFQFLANGRLLPAWAACAAHTPPR